MYGSSNVSPQYERPNIAWAQELNLEYWGSVVRDRWKSEDLKRESSAFEKAYSLGFGSVRGCQEGLTKEKAGSAIGLWIGMKM